MIRPVLGGPDVSKAQKIAITSRRRGGQLYIMFREKSLDL